MGFKQGWKIDENRSVPVTISADVAEGQIGKLTAEGVAAICGAGEMPAGVFPEDRDVSEGETETQLVRANIGVSAAAAAVSSLTTPVKAAAAGTVTPCTTDQDIIVGMPLNAQATVGGDVKIDLTLMGSYYAA